ncbi:MAG: aminotransferase class V-fold PLP-dependent enzyme, partial [Ruminococcus sp.]|nr:aminotransferase class V-fold PLP-dependent enzyme [Ruminococcus sp.]
CRVNAAKLFDIDNPENIIITHNCTTALNTVIKGILKKGDHAIISSLEHNAVVRPLEALTEKGVTYSVADYVPYDDEKTIDNFRNAIQDNTKLVICTQASNVFGVKLPVKRLAAMCKIYGILFCVDAAQSAGVVPVSLKNTDIDFYCTAGHKGLYGPMGTGLLIINSGVLPESLIQGGTGSLSQNLKQPELLPDKYESGTPNLSGIAGLNEGIKFVLFKKIENIEKKEIELASLLYKRLSSIKNVILYTDKPDIKFSVPVISFNIKGYDSEEVAKLLNDRYSIAVRAGLHCAPLAHKAYNTEQIGTVRAVISVFNTREDVSFFAYAVNKLCINSLKVNKK